MYVCEIYNRDNKAWQNSQSIEPQEKFDAVQKGVANQAVECQYRILRDGVQVASWEPATGWRYWRTAEIIVGWYNSPGTPARLFKEHMQKELPQFSTGPREQDFCLALGDRKDFIENFTDYSDASNAYLDAHGLLLPDGALPPGLPKVDKPLHTPAEIAAWCRDHFENQDVRKVVKAEITNAKCWTDDRTAGWHVFFEANCYKYTTDNLVRDLHKYPDLHRVLSRIIDEYVEPAPQTFGWTPRSIAEWDESTTRENVECRFLWRKWRSKNLGNVIYWLNSQGCPSVEGKLSEHPEAFHAACAWLEEHGVKAPASYSAEEVIAWFSVTTTADKPWRKEWGEINERFYNENYLGQKDLVEALRTNSAYLAAVNALSDKHDIQIRKEGSTMTQRSPIFGIKLACGSQIGFQKIENGDVILLTSGPQLNGQTISAEERNNLSRASSKAAMWNPKAQESEWKFE